MSGVAYDTILAKPPPPWIPAFAGYDGYAKVSSRERGFSCAGTTVRAHLHANAKGAPRTGRGAPCLRGVPRNTYLARLLLLSNGQPPFQRPSRCCQRPPPMSPIFIITIGSSRLERPLEPVGAIALCPSALWLLWRYRTAWALDSSLRSAAFGMTPGLVKPQKGTKMAGWVPWQGMRAGFKPAPTARGALLSVFIEMTFGSRNAVMGW